MDFISDADMDKMSNAPTDFISDEEMSKQTAPDFITDHDYNVSKIDTGLAPMLDELVAAPVQGLQKAAAGFMRLGAAGVGKAYELATGEPDTTTETTNKRIADITGVSGHKELKTIPGQAVESIANILPMAVNVPVGALGAASMYNDMVDELVKKGISLSQARKTAATETALMIGGGMGAGKLASTVAEPIVGQMVGKLLGGSAGFAGGVEAARQAHNAMVPELYQDFDPQKVAVNLLAGGMLAAGHPSVELKPDTEVTPEVKTFGPMLEFVAKEGGLSKGEYDLLAPARKLLEDKAEKINQQIDQVERKIGETGMATDEHVQILTTLEEALNKTAEDLAAHERVMSGDVTEQMTTEQQLKQDIRKQDIIAELKARRAGTDTPYVQDLPVEQKTTPIDVTLEKIGEATTESPTEIADRIQKTQDYLESIKDVPENSSIRENLKQELLAYDALRRGEQPDLSWFEQPKTIKNREVPTVEETHDLVRKATSVREVFDILQKSDVGTKGQKQLMQILTRVPHAMSAKFSMRSIEMKNDKGMTANGVYLNGANHEVILGDRGDIRTILHETVHAATVALLEQGTSKSAKNLITLFNQYKEAYSTLPKRKGEHYGFTNAQEFVSEIFTNPVFQKFLSSIAVGPEKRSESMYARFKNIIKEALGITRETRTALDEAIDSASDVIETASRKSEGFFQKLSATAEVKPAFNVDTLPSTKDLRNAVGRNFFGMNTAEGFFRDHPIVQQSFRAIREAKETSERIQNLLWQGSPDVSKMGFMDTLNKVKNKGSAIITVMTTSNHDMAVVHDLFKQGFEEGKDYADNLKDNGSHLSIDQQNAYNTLAKLFGGMYEETLKVQRDLGKKHELPYRPGWYPAKRLGQYSIEISFKGNNVHIETFKTRQAAEIFKRNLSDGSNLKYLEVSDVLDANKKEERQPNKEMADIIGSVLEQKYSTAGPALKKTIDELVYSMQTRGGKLGYHHQFRTNVPGYRGSELFRSRDQLGGSFKEGIQGEVNNFGMNLRTLIVKHKVEPILSDENMKAADPAGHAAIQQFFDSALGRNEDFLETKTGVSKLEHVADKVVSSLMVKVLGKEFQAREAGAVKVASDTAMRLFYATKMMAKPIFVLSQILTTPFIIPEMARDGHGLRAFYSFAKGTMKVVTGDKELMNHIKDISQQYNIIEAQYLESMNLSKHVGEAKRVEKGLTAIEDYVLLGKLGKGADSISRLISYATAYTHFTDLGLSKSEASYQARLAADKAMNVYDSASSAPIFEKAGFIGTGMKPLSSFGLNQLGNFVSYLKDAKKGNVAPLIAYGLVSTAMGGVLSLPFIQEYERFRQIAEKLYDITIPSILEIFSGDESFLDRLTITSQDAKDVALYGIPALSGMDLSSSMRSNETMFSLLAAVALGQEDAVKLFPLLGATYDTAKALVQLPATLQGKTSVGEGRGNIDKLITGPIGYGSKELLGLNTTKILGDNTNMISTGKAGDADMPRTQKDVFAGFLGGRSVEQRRGDQQTFEQTARDKIKIAKVQQATNMLVETGDYQYVDKLISLGVTPDKIMSGIESGVYNKSVDQYLRHFVNKSGHIDVQKAMETLNYGIKK